jgi:DNA repair protein RadC
MARILSEGPGALCDTEVLSALLGAGCDLLAARLLTRGLPALARATPGELLMTHGVSRRHVERVVAALELGRRVLYAPPPERTRLLHAHDLARVLWGKLVSLRHEEFWVILLDTRLQEIESVRIASGGTTQCSVSPREALAPALMLDAPAVAFVHNHPSGDPAPSAEDQRMQMLLDEGAHTLGIRVVDHLVIAETGFHSARQGRCPPVSLVPREGVG